MQLRVSDRVGGCLKELKLPGESYDDLVKRLLAAAGMMLIFRCGCGGPLYRKKRHTLCASCGRIDGPMTRRRMLYLATHMEIHGTATNSVMYRPAGPNTYSPYWYKRNRQS